MLKSLLAFVLVAVTVLLLLPSAEGSGYGYSSYNSGYSYQWWPGGYWRGSYYSPGYYPYYYQPTINVAAFVPFLAYTPVAINTYQPVAAYPAQPLNAVAAVADPCAKHTAGLKKEIDELRQMMKTYAPQPSPVPPEREAAQAPLSGLTVMVTHCGKCHDKATAVKEGKGLVLLDGGKDVMTTVQGLRCIREVGMQRMPKGGKLSDQEMAALLEYLDRRK